MNAAGPDTRRVYPLSHGQQALWFLWTLDPDSAAYNVALPFWYHADVDARVLRRAFQALLDRHPALRCTFGVGESGPIQQVHDRSELAFEAIDARGWTDEQLVARVAEAYRRPFDLRRGPVARVDLFRRSSDAVLLFVVHHVAFDGWSRGLLTRELDALYAAEAAGVPAALPSTAAQYVDFVEWQSRMLDGRGGREHREYWEGRLAGTLPVLDLPTDRPRTHARGRGEALGFLLGEQTTSALRELARSEGVSLFTVLLGAFQVLLSRYTGEEDILVGSPTAGRRPEFRNVVGYFVNPIVVRGDLSGDPTFRELLDRLLPTVIGGLVHADYPFPLLVKALQPKRDSTRTPLFQVLFNLFKLGGSHGLDVLGPSSQPDRSCRVGRRLGGLAGEMFPLVQQLGQFELVLDLLEVGGVLQGILKYDADLFDAATIQRMAGHFRTLLAGIVADPGRRISRLPLMSDDERRRVLVEWNQARAAASGGRCVHELFEAQAQRAPEAAAVVFEGTEVSYRVLNRRANRLAHRLRALGVGPETLVPICMERSPAMVVGVLGILKAGGAYLPMDPAAPRSRLGFIIGDARARVVVTSERLAGGLQGLGAGVLVLDAEGDLGGEGAGDPPAAAALDNLAYVIYTSGSTGQPKGVGVTHRSLASYLAWVNNTLLPHPDLRLPFVTPLTFDGCLKQFLTPLVRGQALWVLSDDEATQPAALARALGAAGPVGLSCVPSLWTAILEEIESGRVGPLAGKLTTLLLGGEAIGRELVDRSLAAVPGLSIWNLYGPTEATCNASANPLRAGDVVTIGRPIAGTALYILDAHLQPVPVGVRGELYIGGPRLARGYLNRPDLTAELFVPDPFGGEAGGRLYRTGDVTRYLSDGRIEYLGRVDHQVKLRGFRIELGEIESVLGEHPAVGQCVVVAREDRPGDKRLVAYVVPRSGIEGSAGEWRGHLRGRLPEYMVPSSYVVLKALPLTGTGKVDRKALPAPGVVQGGRAHGALDTGDFGERDGDAGPRTPMEGLVADLWKQALGIESVGRHENFFDLGGHSLLALRVVAAMERRIGCRINPRELWTQTLEQFAASCDSKAVPVAVPGRPGLAARVKTVLFGAVAWARAAGARGSDPGRVASGPSRDL